MLIWLIVKTFAMIIYAFILMIVTSLTALFFGFVNTSITNIFLSPSKSKFLSVFCFLSVFLSFFLSFFF